MKDAGEKMDEAVLKKHLQKCGEEFRDLALAKAIEICDDLAKVGLGADACSFALRQFKDELHKRKDAA